MVPTVGTTRLRPVSYSSQVCEQPTAFDLGGFCADTFVMARPAKQISPRQIAKLASEGATNIEIADFFECSPDTIERRFAGDLRKGRADRNLSLRRSQIIASKQGNSTMLVWLGKCYLGQSDSLIDGYLLDAIKTAGLTKEDLVNLIQKKDQIEGSKAKKTFEEFCQASDYPMPFEKQTEMMNFGMTETVPRLLLGARGYGKTDYAVILGIAYSIYKDPTDTNLIVTKSRERNAAMLAEIRSACEKNGVVFSKANSKLLRVVGLHGKDHSVSAVTIKTVTLRGRHPKRVIMDDPVTEDDTSDATRLLAEKKYNEILKLAMNVLIIGQPAHKFDLYAKLRGLVKTLELPHGSIPQLDADLDAQRAAGVDEASISASYFLKILAEGSTPFDNVKYMDRFPTGDSAVAFIDPSHEGGDYTAISIFKAHLDGIAVVGFVYKKAWNHCLDEIAPLLTRFNVKRLCFETNALGDQPLEILRTVFKTVGVVGRKSNNNKHSRIMAAGAYAHLIHLSRESDKKYLDHVVQYEYKAKFDDAPDSLATGLEWIGLIRGKK